MIILYTKTEFWLLLVIDSNKVDDES